MKDFTFTVPQNIVFGKGSLARLPEYVQALGASHPFLVSDPMLAQLGLVGKCADALTAAGMTVDAFTETEANPSVDTVEKAKDQFLASSADCLVALGGGSPMDVAKAVGVVAKYGGSITEYEGGGKVPGDIIPLIAIPTTAGTGSEVTAFSVITDHSRNYKLTVFSYKLLPSYAILDPTLITSVPAGTAAACGIDAMIHALEAYISTAASPFSEAMSEKALELIGKNLRAYVANRANEEAASAMQVGALFAGIAFSWARLGNVHAMSHPVSAYFNVAHGVANAIILPEVVAYNALADQGKYETIYRYIARNPVPAGCFETEMLEQEIRDLNDALGIPRKLSDVGVTEDKIPAMAADAMKSGNVLVNPRATNIRDIEVLYRKLL